MKSYWIESIDNQNQSFPELTKDEDVDVCIIGGGLTRYNYSILFIKNKPKSSNTRKIQNLSAYKPETPQPKSPVNMDYFIVI